MKFWWRFLKRTVLILLVFMATISLALYIFEDRIIKKVVAQVNTYLKAPVQVEQINVHFWRTFPQLSVAFDQVLIADPLSSKDTLLQAEQISLRFNPFDIWNGQYQIEQITSFNGQLNLKTNAKGQTNYDIFKDTSSGSSSFNLELETILLEQFKVSYRDQKSAQSYTSTIHTASLSGKFSAQQTTLKAAGDVWLNRIQKGRVVLLKNEPLVFDLALLVDQTQNLIKLPQAQIKIANLPFLIDAEFYPVKSSLDIRSENLSLIQLVRTVQPASMAELKRVKAKGKVDFHLHYEDALDRENPLVHAYFNIEKGELTEPKFGAKIENLQCYGTYLNIDTDNLVIEQLQFNTGGAHFFGQFQLSNFLRPKLAFSAKGTVPLSLIQAIYPLDDVNELGGVAQLNVRAKVVQDQQNKWQTQEIKGRVGIKSAQVRFADYKNVFRELSTSVTFDEHHLDIRDLKAKVGNSDLNLQLQIPEYLQQFSRDLPLQLSGSLRAQHFDVADFDTESTNQKRDWMLPEQINLSLPFDIQQLKYENKEIHQLKGSLKLSAHELLLEQLKFNHTQGYWNGQLKLSERAPSTFEIETNGSAKKVDLGTLFKEWENFDQSILTDQHLSGKGNFDFIVQTKYDYFKGLDEQSLRAQINCQIDHGRLLHAPILQDLANTLTVGKGRPILGAKNQQVLQQKLKDVRFEQLNNTFTIANRQLKFEKMHIASSALDLDLVGSHSFEHQIDYAVGLRLRDLLVQETQTEFGEILDDGTGLRLFVRISGPLDDPKVSWDKKGKKEAAQEQFERSQQESKEILKATFGLYKNDPNVGSYQEKTSPHETIQVKFDKDKKPVKSSEPPPPTSPRNSKLQQKLDKWKQEQEQTGVEIKIKG
jgi:hypothetical protein